MPEILQNSLFSNLTNNERQDFNLNSWSKIKWSDSQNLDILVHHKNIPKMPKTEMKSTATPSIQNDQILSFGEEFRKVYEITNSLTRNHKILWMLL